MCRSVFRFLYKKILKKILFLFDPEKVHDRFLGMGSFLGKYKLTRKLTRLCFRYDHPILEQEVLGIKFKNPIGLAAGFDKNIILYKILSDVGFGFMEGGSVTGERCEGNPKPRLWRMPEKKSLHVNYGLCNDGSEVISKRISTDNIGIPLGISMAQTNCKETAVTEAGIKDYLKAYNLFKDVGAYDTINISCPNAYGGQPFTDPEKLGLLLSEIDYVRGNKPIFLKISPDLSLEQLDKIVVIAEKYNIDGLTCSNLTKQHDYNHGGLSGKAVTELSRTHLKYLYKNYGDKFVLVACGGIFTAEDAYNAIRSGASLIQLITGMIYEGPQVIGEINKGIAEHLIKDGYTRIKDAIGIDV